MKKFEIVIKNDRVKIYQRIIFLLVFLNILFALSFLFNGMKGSFIISLSIIILFIALTFFISRHKKRLFSYIPIFFLLTILWIYYNNYWIAAIDFLLSILYLLATKKVVYEVNATEVKQRSFPWSKYSWENISNIVLKDDMLTLDFKNNKIAQFEILGNNNFDEKEFNAFVRQQLNISTAKQ